MAAEAKKSTSKKTHTHIIVRPRIAQPESDIQVDEDVFIIPKPLDDDKNCYHDKSKPVKAEVTCDSDKDIQEEASAALAIPMGPVKPRRCKSKTAVKGLYVCQICGQDYINKSDFNNHMQQHEPSHLMSVLTQYFCVSVCVCVSFSKNWKYQ